MRFARRSPRNGASGFRPSRRRWIPTEENPVSQTVCTSPYEDKDQRLADFLGTIQGRFDEFLEEVDGRESLVMYGRVGEKNP